MKKKWDKKFKGGGGWLGALLRDAYNWISCGGLSFVEVFTWFLLLASFQPAPGASLSGRMMYAYRSDLFAYGMLPPPLLFLPTRTCHCGSRQGVQNDATRSSYLKLLPFCGPTLQIDRYRWTKDRGKFLSPGVWWVPLSSKIIVTSAR